MSKMSTYVLEMQERAVRTRDVNPYDKHVDFDKQVIAEEVNSSYVIYEESRNG